MENFGSEITTKFDFKNWRHNIALIAIILIVTFVFVSIFKKKKQEESYKKGEKKWYAENLEYDFSARVDTAFELRQHYGYGRLYCTPLVIRKFNYSREDSLDDHLIYHDRLRFIWKDKDGQVNFMVTSGKSVSTADSVVVNSASSKILFFRNEELIEERSIFWSLEGH